ncbi:hypothetical protein GQ44DRAFT_701221 [Phaeosphaeriaceae sp. PMI808]|nr:hypothetical protein GQ44DRAFT_701221 [Phaeosphaeriaceae sp. PMI808]
MDNDERDQEIKALKDRLQRQDEEIIRLRMGRAGIEEINEGLDELPPEEDVNETHLKDLQNLTDIMNSSVQSLITESPKHNRVVVLTAYWEDCDRRHIPNMAKEVGKVFNERYGFEIQPCIIGSETPADDLGLAIRQVRQKVNKPDQDNLFVLYYIGHGTRAGGKTMWHATGQKDSPRLDWSEEQASIHTAQCDMLLIFDCCYALSMVDQEQPFKKRCEILGAAGITERAGGDSDNSFTSALLHVLNSLREPTLSIYQLHNQLTTTKILKDFKLVATPGYKSFSKRGLSGLRLGPIPVSGEAQSNAKPRVDSVAKSVHSMQEMGTFTNARMLVAIRFLNPGEKPIQKEFEDWVRRRPHNIGDMSFSVESLVQSEVKSESGYESDSGLLLVSMPLWLWAHLPSSMAIQSVGVIRSSNLLAPRNGSESIRVPIAITKADEVKFSTAPETSEALPKPLQGSTTPPPDSMRYGRDPLQSETASAIPPIRLKQSGKSPLPLSASSAPGKKKSTRVNLTVVVPMDFNTINDLVEGTTVLGLSKSIGKMFGIGNKKSSLVL